MMANVKIGTSGWVYTHWEGNFYPSNMPTSSYLAFYGKNFDTVEVNSSFYYSPQKHTIENWLQQTPPNFVFSCKASRYITHLKKLKDPKESLHKLFVTLEYFENKLGPILFQLPSRWTFQKGRLDSFLERLTPTYQYTFEFRDTSWLCQETYDLLAEHKCSLCFYDYQDYQSPEEITADFIYIRLHGPYEEPYTGSYSAQKLIHYAKKINTWANQGKTVYCYFNNDQAGYALRDAQRLREELKKIKV